MDCRASLAMTSGWYFRNYQLSKRPGIASWSQLLLGSRSFSSWSGGWLGFSFLGCCGIGFGFLGCVSFFFLGGFFFFGHFWLGFSFSSWSGGLCPWGCRGSRRRGNSGGCWFGFGLCRWNCRGSRRRGNSGGCWLGSRSLCESTSSEETGDQGSEDFVHLVIS